MTRRTFAVRWVAATLSAWAVLVPLSLGLDLWPLALPAGACSAVASLFLATSLPAGVRAVGTWAGLVLLSTLPFLGTPDFWNGALFTAWFLTFPIVAWLAVAVSAFTILRLAGVLPRKPAERSPAPAAPAYGS